MNTPLSPLATSPAVTKFPTMRRFMRASAMAVPLLFYSAFLLAAAQHLAWSLLLLAVAFILGLAFPSLLTDRSPAPAPVLDADQGWLRFARRAAFWLIYWWVISQPECMAFITRALEHGGLWDWRLMAASFGLALCSIVSGLRRVAIVSDRAIYDYFTFGSPATSGPAKAEPRPATDPNESKASG